MLSSSQKKKQKAYLLNLLWTCSRQFLRSTACFSSVSSITLPATKIQYFHFEFIFHLFHLIIYVFLQSSMSSFIQLIICKPKPSSQAYHVPLIPQKSPQLQLLSKHFELELDSKQLPLVIVLISFIATLSHDSQLTLSPLHQESHQSTLH